MTISIETNKIKIKIKTTGFSGGERHIQLDNLPKIIPKSLNVQGFIHNSDDLLDLLLFQNALNNHYGKAVSINLELPYLPYSRQDRVCAIGQAFSLEVMASLLKSLNLNQLVTWDCHSKKGLELTSACNVEASEIINSCTLLKNLMQAKDSVLVCPDKGAINRCTQLKEFFNLKHMVQCEKIRNPKTGKITHTNVLVEDLSNKTAIIADDICDGGFTFIKIAEQLQQKNVSKIVLYVTHGIFSKGLSVFNGLIDQVFTTQSFPQKPNAQLQIINFNSILGESP